VPSTLTTLRCCLLGSCAALALAWAVGGGVTLARAADPVPEHIEPGTTFDTLQVGGVIYQHVLVRSVNARTLMISHDGGIASIRLRDLPPELQTAADYSPESEAAADAALQDAKVRAKQARAREAQAHAATSVKQPASAAASQMDRLMQSFGQPPEIRAGVDLRPKYSELGLNVKNQGARPSCSVFAVVSALEFQNAQLTGKAEHFSEEYLLWATCKTLNRVPRVPFDAGVNIDTENPETKEIADEGFALSEVVTALRAYGIPLQSRLPYTFGRNNTVADPPGEVIDEARSHRRVSVFALPGRDARVRLANLIHALNAGVPVAVGLRWPPARALRTGYLAAQVPRPDGGHAVTIVGYENKTGAIADTVFIFKNSWGARWGAGGFGYATYGYLAANLEDTAMLDVEPGELAKTAR
jgi:hypothetical protein